MALSSGPQLFTGANNIMLTQPTFNVAENIIFNSSHDRTIDRLREVVEWLTPINFRSIQIDMHAKCTPGTGEWFINGKEFQAWLSGEAGILWVIGTPGTGKTILTSIVVDYLSNHLHAKPGIAVIFGYFRYTDSYSPSDLLASFVKQLVELCASLPPYVEEIYNEHKRKATRLSEDELIRLFQILSQAFTTIYVVMDALDEASDHCRTRLLGELLSLPVSILIMSRPLDLEPILPKHAVRHVIQDQTAADIELFALRSIEVSPRLQRLLKGDDQLRSNILANLKEKSKAMFLAVSLQVEALSKCNTKSSLRSAAQSLPSGLDDIYSDTLRRIEGQEKEDVFLAIRAVVWLTYAFRSLTIAELQHALATSSDKPTFSEDDITPIELIISLCCGLVVVEEASRTVRLAHYTAHDFLKRELSSHFANAQTFITSSCIAYLSAFNFKELAGADKRRLYTFLRNGELLKYAYIYWGHHARSCYDEDGPPDCVQGFILSIPKYPFLLQPKATAPIIEDFWPCHLAAYYGLPEVLPLTEGFQYWRTSRKRTPLILASEQGHKAIIEYLLAQAGVNVNAKDVSGRTALHEAALYGHEEIVRLLLSRPGIAINIKSRPGRTVLHEATRAGHEAIFRMLLACPGVDVNAEGKSGRTVLHEAAEMGHDVLVKLLLSQQGIDVAARDTFGSTALDEASRYGREPVVTLLSAVIH